MTGMIRRQTRVAMPWIGLAACLAAGADALAAQPVSVTRLRADVRFLASDLLEGRAPGTRGGDLTAAYLAAQFAHAGLEVALQPVPLVGVETRPDTSLNGLRWLADFAGHTQQQREDTSFDAEAYFAGHGITAPEFGWDDYAGADLRGKVVVVFTNEPPSTDPKLFGGRALTYYGRWTYKFEEAARRGAAAVLIIHTPATAGYGWDVVRNSWGREDAQVRLAAGASAPAFAGWLSEAGAQSLLKQDVAALLAQADTRGFRARPLGVRIAGRVLSRIRSVESHNVAGIWPGGSIGSESNASRQAVVFSAHWDHLGRDARATGDGIFNGAVDNATGCAALLEIARLWTSLKPRPARRAVFLATTAEEAGLRGAFYYAANPLVGLGDTVLNLNFDSFHPFGRTRDVVLDGWERTPFRSRIEHIASRHGLAIRPDPAPENGGYFRSDHFAFAKAGVPAFSVKLGPGFAADAEVKQQRLREFGARHYHQPSDEYSEDWDFAGLEQVVRLGFDIGLAAANAPDSLRTAPPPAQPGPAKPAPVKPARPVPAGNRF